MSGLAWRTALLLTVGVVLMLGLSPEAEGQKTGQVEVRVTDHRAGIGDFTVFRVELAEVSLHPRGQPRGQGWVEVIRHAAAVDIVPLKDGRWAMVGQGSVAAARYDAVRVRFGAIRGVLRHGGLAEALPFGSTIAVDLTIELGTTRVVLIDLYVEDQADHASGRYALKVQAVH